MHGTAVVKICYEDVGIEVAPVIGEAWVDGKRVQMRNLQKIVDVKFDMIGRPHSAECSWCGWTKEGVGYEGTGKEKRPHHRFRFSRHNVIYEIVLDNWKATPEGAFCPSCAEQAVAAWMLSIV